MGASRVMAWFNTFVAHPGTYRRRRSFIAVTVISHDFMDPDR